MTRNVERGALQLTRTTSVFGVERRSAGRLPQSAVEGRPSLPRTRLLPHPSLTPAAGRMGASARLLVGELPAASRGPSASRLRLASPIQDREKHGGAGECRRRSAASARWAHRSSVLGALIRQNPRSCGQSGLRWSSPSWCLRGLLPGSRRSRTTTTASATRTGATRSWWSGATDNRQTSTAGGDGVHWTVALGHRSSGARQRSRPPHAPSVNGIPLVTWRRCSGSRRRKTSRCTALSPRAFAGPIDPRLATLPSRRPRTYRTPFLCHVCDCQSRR